MNSKEFKILGLAKALAFGFSVYIFPYSDFIEPSEIFIPSEIFTVHLLMPRRLANEEAYLYKSPPVVLIDNVLDISGFVNRVCRDYAAHR